MLSQSHLHQPKPVTYNDGNNLNRYIYMNDNIHPLDTHIYYTSHLISPKNANKICNLNSFFIVAFFTTDNKTIL